MYLMYLVLSLSAYGLSSFVPGSKVGIWGMAIPPSIGNHYIGYINPTIGLMTIPYCLETIGV